LAKAVCRKNDINSGGGAVINGISNVLVNGLPIGVKTVSNVKSHDKHPTNPIVQGDASVIAGTGKSPVAFVSCSCNCGHTMQEGSNNVLIRGIPSGPKPPLLQVSTTSSSTSSTSSNSSTNPFSPNFTGSFY